MQLNWTELLKSTMVMFAVIDIVGSIPFLLDIKKKAGDIHAEKASLVALGIMLAFLFLGEGVINFLGIDVNSFAVAGSIVMFFMALEMILGITLFKQNAESMKTATIVPVAFPLIAGAGSMTSIISLRAEFAAVNIAIAILVNMALVYLVLRLTGRIERALGEGGIAVLQKVFGIILLAIAVVAIFGANLRNAMIAVGVVTVPVFCRITRASVLTVREREYVTAARAQGASHTRLLFLYILPNCVEPLLVQASLSMGTSVLDAAGLSFLGLGAKPPTPEWGTMLGDAFLYYQRAPWCVAAPGAMIFLMVLAFNLFGDSLQDAFDPRSGK